MMDPKHFLSVTGQLRLERNGQHLILSEILTLLYPFDRIWVPFPAGCQALLNRLHAGPWEVVLSGFIDVEKPKCDAIYFGTPTIVEGKPLFPETAGRLLTKDLERAAVRNLCTDNATKATRVKLIVCGLGSGDISVEERLEDVGKGAEVITMKQFRERESGSRFTDWVIARELF